MINRISSTRHTCLGQRLAASALVLGLLIGAPLLAQDQTPTTAERQEQGFVLSSRPLPTGLYQVARGVDDALFVTRTVGNPPVSDSQILKIDADSLEITDKTTPPQIAADAARGVFAVYGIAADNTHATVWTSNSTSGAVAVYKQQDLSLIKQFDAKSALRARAIAIDHGQGKAFVTLEHTKKVAVFNLDTLEHVRDIEIDDSDASGQFLSFELALDPDGHRLYVSSLETREVAVINTETNASEKILTLDRADTLRGLAWDAAGQQLLVTSWGNGLLLVVDVASDQLTHAIEIGSKPLTVAWNPSDGLAYVANFGDRSITAADPAAGKVVAKFEIGSLPNHVIATEDGTVFALNRSTGASDQTGNRITRITRITHAVP